MSEEKISQLEGELRVAQELLFLVLDDLAEPVVLNIEDAKSRMKSDRMIDLHLDTDEGTWTLQVVNVPDVAL